ncbi:MAG TPA: tetratricopeptide repeat protein [Gemmatimonadales bacterium]
MAGLLGRVAPAAAQAKDTEPTLPQLEARVAGGDSLDAETQLRLARRYYQANRFDDEERALHAAVAADPRYAPAWFWLGFLPFDRRPKLWKDVEKGKVGAEWAQPLADAERMRVRAVLIDPFVDFRVMGAAEPKDSNIVITIDPAYFKEASRYILFSLGIDAFAYGHYETAYDAWNQYYQHVYQGQPDDSVPAFIFYYRGFAAAHLKLWDVSIRDFQALFDRNLKAEQSDSLIQVPLATNDFRYIVAVLTERLDKPADAVRLYQDVITSDLGAYMAHAHLAGLYRRFQMWDKAVAEARAAVQANPDDASLLLDLGEILEDARHLPDAAAAYRDAATLDPHLAIVPYRLGLVEAALGKTAEAKTALQHFVAIAPHRLSTEIADAKQRMFTLQ